MITLNLKIKNDKLINRKLFVRFLNLLIYNLHDVLLNWMQTIFTKYFYDQKTSKYVM